MKNENILCVKRESIERFVDINMNTISFNENEIKNIFNNIDFLFINRYEAENDPIYKQIIPYCLVINEKNQFLSYERNGSESRLHGFRSFGIGGHINDLDSGKNLYEIIINGAKREIMEELPQKNSNFELKISGIINEDQTKVGKVHLGIVCIIKVETKDIIKYDEELLNQKWLSISDIENYSFEEWSNISLPFLKKEIIESELNKVNLRNDSVISSNIIIEKYRNLLDRKIFIILSEKLAESQENELNKHFFITNFIYMPDNFQKIWSNIHEKGSLNLTEINEIIEWIKANSNKNDLVLVQGDYGATYYMVQNLSKIGLVAIYFASKNESISYEENENFIQDESGIHKISFRRYIG